MNQPRLVPLLRPQPRPSEDSPQFVHKRIRLWKTNPKFISSAVHIEWLYVESMHDWSLMASGRPGALYIAPSLLASNVSIIGSLVNFPLPSLIITDTDYSS